MNNELFIATSMKKFIFSLREMVANVPNRERELKNRILNNGFDTLELIYFANSLDLEKRKIYIKQVISKLAIMDFYLEYLYENKYINKKQCEKRCHHILMLRKMVYKWAKDGNNDNA